MSRNEHCDRCELHRDAHTVCLYGEYRAAPSGRTVFDMRASVVGRTESPERADYGASTDSSQRAVTLASADVSVQAEESESAYVSVQAVSVLSAESTERADLKVSSAPAVRIMILGEAPGFNEDQQGRPFVGASGVLLLEALTAAGLDQRGYYVSNTVKCFPAETKVIAKHAKACAPYLEEEISNYQPTHILALGNTALQRVMGGKGTITAQAGKEQWSEKYDCWVMGAFHPAYILRSAGQKSAWLEDIHRFARLVSGELLKDPPVMVHTVGTKGLSVVRGMLETGYPFTYDFEATPIPWWHQKFRAYSLAFSWDGKNSIVIPIDHPSSTIDKHELPWWSESIREVMQDPDVPKSPHNMLYDDLVWNRIFGYLPYATMDTMVAVQLLNENEPKGLKWQGRSRLGWPDWDIDIVECFVAAARELGCKGSDRDAVIIAMLEMPEEVTGPVIAKHLPFDQMVFYNGCDAAATLLLRDKYIEMLSAQPNLYRYMALLEMPKLRALERMMVNGIYVDPHTLKEHWAQCKASMTSSAATIPVENPNSSDQVAAWLYSPISKPLASIAGITSSTDKSTGTPQPATSLGLPVLSWTPGGKPSTDEATINLLALAHPEVPELKQILEVRKWKKYDSTYFAYADMITRKSFDRRAHFDYRSTAVETGRLSSRFHTQPRDPFVKAIYSSPPGWTLLSADYSQIEARIAAWWAAGKPPTWDQVDPMWGGMLLAFRDPKRDVYRETAAATLRKLPSEVTSQERQLMGKVPSLAMIYRISAEGFRSYAWSGFEVLYTKAEAEHLHRTFYRTWPEIERWHRQSEKILQYRGYAESPLGRIRRLPAAMSENRKIMAEAVRAGINAPIQVCASDILQEAMILLDADLQADNGWWDVKITGNVHDDLTFEVPDDLVEDWTENVVTTMEVLVPHRLQQLGLYLPEGLLKVEISAGPWGTGRVVWPR